MKRLIVLCCALSLANVLRAAETSQVDYGQTVNPPTLSLVWQYETQTDGEVTYAVITGLRDEVSAYPSGEITVPTTVYDGANGYVVKAIADSAFKNQIGITSISIPITVQTIGVGVFTGCSVLGSISVDASNPWFASTDNALYDKDFLTLVACPALSTSVSIPASVMSIATEAFAGCHRLTAVTVPSEVSSVGQRAFMNCTHLKSVTFKGNAPAADNTIFLGSPDPTVYKQKLSTGWNVQPWTSFPVKDSDSEQVSATTRTNAGNVSWSYRVLGNGEAEIYNNGIDPAIPAGTRETYTLVTSDSGSSWSADGTLNIPSELDGHPVTKIGKRAFAGCSALLGVTIPSCVTCIDDGAFENCSSVEEITLPNALEELGCAPFAGTWISSLNLPAKLSVIDGNPFAGCTYIDAISVDAKSRRFVVADNILYNREKTKLYGVLSYHDDAFVETITVPPSAVLLSANAFSTCEFLTNVTFNCNAPTLEDDELFADTALVLTIYTAAGTTGWNGDTSSTNLPASGFWPENAVSRRRIISLYDPEPGHDPGDEINRQTDASGITWYYRIVDNCAELYNGENCAVSSETPITTLTLPSTLGTYLVKSIGERAFANLRGITSVSIPATYESIGDSAFSNCTSLASLTLAHGLRTIGLHAFAGTALETIEIPDTVEHIDGNPIWGCRPSVSLVLSETNPFFSSSEEGALYDKDFASLRAVPMTAEKLAIPTTCTNIAREAFASCIRMKGISFAGDAPNCEDGDAVFADCHADLKIIVTKGNTTFGPLPGIWHFRPVSDSSAPAEEGTYTEKIGSITWTFKIENGVAILRKGELSVSGDIGLPSELKGSPVTTVGSGSLADDIFSDPDKATGVTVPASVTNVNSYAFYSCSSLAFADLSAAVNLKHIGTEAFYGCSMLSTLEVPAACLTIDDGAFQGCNSLTDVILPGRMVSLGSSVFYNCSTLQSIAMPTNLTGIARNAFYGCSALRSVTLPENLKTIAQYAFNGCSSLKSITIPKTVTALGAYSFNDCTTLTEATFAGGIPSGLKNSHLLDHITNINCPEALYDTYKNWLTENGYTCTVNNKGEPEKELKTDGTWYYHIVDGYAELWCTNGAGDHVTALVNPQTVGTLTLPTTLGNYIVKSIAPSALSNLRGIEDVSIPATYESIGDYAFSNCTSLASLTLSYGLRTIGCRPFVNTAIRELELPDTLLEMDGNVVAGTLYNTSIVISDSSHFVYSDGGVLYNRDMTKLYACPTRAEGSVTIPTSVTNICRDAFFGCFRLTYLNLPETVCTIGEGAFNVSGIWPGLPAPESKPKLTSVFYNGREPVAADGIYDGAPASLVSYVSWKLEPTTTVWKGRRIMSLNVANPPILQLTDEDNVTWFYRIVDGVAEIYNDGKAAISPKSTSGQLHVLEDGDTEKSFKGLLIPATINGYTVRTLGDHAFDGCTGLTIVGIPDTVETIGDYAFKSCTALKVIEKNYALLHTSPDDLEDGTINIPYGVTKIGNRAFDGTKLLTLNLPTTVKTLDGNPLAGCEFLTEVTVDANNPKFAVVSGILYDKRKTTLVGVPANIDATSVSVPPTVTAIGPEAFFDCAGLDGVALADSVTTLGPRAFAGCAALEKLTIPAAVTDIRSHAFSNCTALVQVTYLGDAPTAADDIYDDTPATLTSYASAKTQGWSGDMWKNRPLVIRSAEEDPESDDLKETDAQGITWRYRVVDSTAEIYSSAGTAVSSETPITTLALPTTLGTYLVKSIGERAFANLRGITSVSIPATYESIGDSAFSNCTSLASVTIGSGVRRIGKAPFFGTGLNTLTIPASIATLDGNPGAGAASLRAFTVDANNLDFAAANGLLYDKAVQTLLACPAGLSSITLPKTTRTIAADAFALCKRLTDVTALCNEPIADESIFADTPLSLTTSADACSLLWTNPSATTWKHRPFRNISTGNVSSMTDESGCVWTYTVNGSTVSLGAYGETPVIPVTTEGEITVPETLGSRPVTEIPDSAFANCEGVTKITLPASIERIAANAFNGCSSLGEFAVVSDNPNFSSRNKCLYSKDGKTLLRVPPALLFAANQTQTTSEQRMNIVEVGGFVTNSKTISQKTTRTFAYVFTPVVTAEKILAGVTVIADNAFSDCGLIPEDSLATGTLVSKENGKNVYTHKGTFYLPFSTESVTGTATTNEISATAGFRNGKPTLNRTVAIVGTAYVTDVPLVIPASVVTVAVNAFENAHFTSITREQAQTTSGLLMLQRFGGTADVYGPLTPGVSVSLDLSEFAGCTASGLPTGMKWIKATGELKGIPTKPATFTMTFKEGRTVVDTIQIRVADYPTISVSALRTNPLTGSNEPIAVGEKLSFYVGVAQNFTLPISDDLPGVLNTLTAKGLPLGLKLVKTAVRNEKRSVTNYVYTITGTPTKAQAAKTVTLSISNKYKWSGTHTFEIEVLALPVWTAGSFNGVRYDTSSNAYGAASATLSTVGKLSGKFLVPSDDLTSGKSYAFSAATLTAYDPANDTFLGTATMKIGRESFVLPFTLAKNNDGTGLLHIETPDGFADLVQNIWNRKDLVAPAYAKGTKITIDGLTFKFAAKGVVTWSGKIEDDSGKLISVSGSSQLLNGKTLLLYIPAKRNLLGGICQLITLD